ncbi:MAG: hypothetical protein EBS56_11320, partial [Planctomycetia bacterium]|nr:hypothetical protein [Planctomycetia bacterium]
MSFSRNVRLERLCFEPLDPRRMLTATATLDARSGTLAIVGDDAADAVTVSIVEARVVVEAADLQTSPTRWAFPAGGVKTIVFRG